ncbi:hypothetical protein KIPB_003397 [Kipferlia bialata]|uniref:Uncharacterized protein n=1 Tax=Kipferlia bialata TaxID=797122 RepID=A0A391NQ76_9EUKA|nr:hypothetical protein KIPB_003083 [Kipferlia bialata]GCA62416.1 hypothetical protein KIPB_003397 [Kipferlia bialata]|eukprot:g3083.t1
MVVCFVNSYSILLIPSSPRCARALSSEGEVPQADLIAMAKAGKVYGWVTSANMKVIGPIIGAYLGKKETYQVHRVPLSEYTLEQVGKVAATLKDEYLGSVVMSVAGDMDTQWHRLCPPDSDKEDL